jgi:iron-sulfur cluster assembly protein
MSEAIQNQDMQDQAGSAAPAGKPTSLAITDKAVAEIKRIKANDPTAADANLRVMVVGGGCSGMSYKLGFDAQPLAASDKTFEKDGVKVVCDAKSFLYLAGTELDFTDGLNGTGFVFKNPNAKRTCGCGSSFSA